MTPEEVIVLAVSEIEEIVVAAVFLPSCVPQTRSV